MMKVRLPRWFWPLVLLVLVCAVAGVLVVLLVYRLTAVDLRGLAW